MSDVLSIVLLILAGAVFAMSEISIAAARKIKLRVMADEGNTKALEVLELQQQPGNFFAMMQIALNGISILGGIIGEQALTPYIKQVISLFYQGALLNQISFILSFICLTSLFILFADLLPKRLAIIMPESVAIRIVSLMRSITFLLMPAVFLFNGLTNMMLRLLHIPTERTELVTTEDIIAMMDAGAEDGSLQKQEYQLIGNVFDLDVRTIGSVMTPRDQIIYFDLDDSSEDISQKIIEQPHNDFLVCNGGLDNIEGSIESKEILRLVLKGELAQIHPTQVDKDLFYLPETLTLSEALNAFKVATQPFAVIVNEYATVVGIVTVKDLLSSFMGELITHQDEEQIVQRDESSWLIEGLTPINDVMRCLSIEDFPDRTQYETIAGFMIYTLKRLPKRTDHFTHQDYKFEVLDLEGVRVEQILVTKLK
ncbi:hemolysin family protein [Psychromonas sp. 14N.309.X.WAT.B.A12]|uniref:hemolysin family protein n=1 Tax=unclassified Psychromonas TaxID=2614957 RepID=UPI0025B0C9DB|nr:hemolysin family protein [Psychromonas sp. 14N.309.X.WAT.B.A12]MDN2663617.1 hemolysin family protein [Psychromonas sp. 14N.309.X.WAT.B.A12]